MGLTMRKKRLIKRTVSAWIKLFQNGPAPVPKALGVPAPGREMPWPGTCLCARAWHTVKMSVCLYCLSQWGDVVRPLGDSKGAWEPPPSLLSCIPFFTQSALDASEAAAELQAVEGSQETLPPTHTSQALLEVIPLSFHQI